MARNGRPHHGIFRKGSRGSDKTILWHTSEAKIMSALHIIRHGTTAANIKRLYYGSTDLPLADEGIAQIKELVAAKKYPNPDGAMLYTSGLLRTEQTFSLIYGCREHERISELKEYHFGDFEMRAYDELKEIPEYQAWISDEKGLTSPPNGESPVGFRKRVRRGLNKLLAVHHQVKIEKPRSIVVCHGGVIAAIMGMCFPDAGKNIYEWQPEPGRGYTINLENGEPIDYEMI